MPAAFPPPRAGWLSGTRTGALLAGSVLTGALFTGAVAGCASAPPPLVGVSDAAPEVPTAREPVTAPRATWPELQAARAWPEAGPATTALAHRRDGSLVHVRVDPASLPAYRGLAAAAPMPDGARVIAWHETPTGQVLDGYLLEKRAGAWSAALIDARGALLVGSPACLRCHDMAPADHLFGRPAPPPPAASVESISPTPR